MGLLISIGQMVEYIESGRFEVLAKPDRLLSIEGGSRSPVSAAGGWV